MRLIDADALKKSILARLDDDEARISEIVEEEIDNAPTECEAYRSFCMVKQRPQGEWVECEDSWFKRCSSCRKIILREETKYYKFCPNCGAEMRGDKNG